jgi:hypothetical protein
MAIYSLNSALERSITDYISSNITGSIATTPHFYTGINNEDKDSPAVIVSAHMGHEVYWNTNVYMVSVNIICKEIAYDTLKSDMGILAANVFNFFYDPNRNINFTSNTYGVSVFQVQPLDITTEVSGDTSINTLTCDFVACLNGTNF